MSDVTIPARPSLEFDRKQAKRLLKAIQQGDKSAIARLCGNHPRYPDAASVDPAAVSLNDVYLAIAREYGFSSWPEWKHFVELSALAASEKLEKFLQCVCSREVGMAERLLRNDDGIAERDICAAAACGRVDLVKALIGADPDCVHRMAGPLDATPLVYACQSRLLVTDPARREGIAECARLLLEAGADPNGAFLAEGEHADLPQSALYGAAGIANHAGLTRLLLEAGADPNDGLRGKPGETLYHVAEFGDTTCLRMILEAGPDKAALDYCLARALDFERPDAAMLFVQHGADVEYRVPWFANQTHLMKAIRNDADIRLLEAMIDKATDLDMVDDNGFSAYRLAVRAGRADVAALLERKGVNTGRVTVVDRALGACVRGDGAALDAILAEQPRVADLLDDADKEVLPFSARRMNRGAIPLLLKLGIPVDAGVNMPALHEACFCGDFDGVEQLVEAGASLTMINVHGSDALGVAIHGSVNCHDVLGGPKAQPPEAIEPRGYARIVEYLIARGAPLPAKEAGSRAVIEVLQRHGVQGR